MNKYDVVIVGAGPCGLFAALELMSKYKVAIVDAGVTYDQRICKIDTDGKCKYCKPVCHVLGGFGGAQFLHGTKLSTYPAGTGLLQFSESLSELTSTYDYVDSILENYGKPCRSFASVTDIAALREKFSVAGLDVKYYNSQKISQVTMKHIVKNIKDELSSSGVDMRFGEIAQDISKFNGELRLRTDKNEYFSKSIILCVGRLGARHLLRLADASGISYNTDFQDIEIGVRVEGPHAVMSQVDDIHNDLKLYNKLNENEEIRSFCQCYKGYICKCVYNLSGDKIVSTVDGYIGGIEGSDGKCSEVFNLGIHHRFTSKDSISKIYKSLQKMSAHGKIIIQPMKNFMSHKTESVKYLNRPTLFDVSEGDINAILPQPTLLTIKEYIRKIDTVLPGFADDRNIVYAPSFELGWAKMDLDRNFESTLKGVYIGGDSTGHFRGAMQAAVSGIFIANDICRRIL